jgi:hypothetical protein
VQGRDRNLVWRCFTGAAGRVEHPDPDRHEVISRYPADRELAAMVSELRGISPRFTARWEHPAIARHGGERKTVHNPAVGALTLDCDVLTVHGNDLRIVVFTATPGTPDADKLAVLNVIGAQDFPLPEATDRPSLTPFGGCAMGRGADDTGLRNLPLKGFAANQLWCEVVALACDLLAIPSG